MHITALPVLRRRKKSRAQRIKQMIIAAIPVAAAKKAVPDSAKGKGKAAGVLALAAAGVAGAGYKLRGRSDASEDHGDGNGFAANIAGPVSPPATPTV